MVTSNAQRSIVEWAARRCPHLYRASEVRLRPLKAKAHRRFRQYVSRQLRDITRGVMDAEDIDLLPGKRMLTCHDTI